MGSNCCKQPNYFGKRLHSGEPRIASITNIRDKKTVSAVVVTFHALQSYDCIFTEVPQKSRQGTKVAVYSCDAHFIERLQNILKNERQAEGEVEKALVQDLKSVHSDCVVFNWECSVGYGQEQFPQGRNLIIDRGYMAMFSDHSLKLLIKQWDQNVLGPNPFLLVSIETLGAIELRFDPIKLKESPSSQLRILGDFCKQGKVNINTQSQTIIYTVDKTEVYGGFYDLQVLSIYPLGQNYISNWRVKSTKKNDSLFQRNIMCKIGSNRGTAGHTLLKYRSGGKILTSMTHWIQLSNLEVQPERYFQVAREQYGTSYTTAAYNNYQKLPPVQQKRFVQTQAINMIQNHVPCLEKHQI